MQKVLEPLERAGKSTIDLLRKGLVVCVAGEVSELQHLKPLGVIG
jgi:hypothetical protein